MQIQVHTDNHISSDARLHEYSEGAVAGALAHFADRITRVEIHLADENGAKEGGPFRCSLEVRLAGHEPVGVSHHGPHVKEALAGALDKAATVIGGLVSREKDHR
jgi:hypothetical protein